MFNNFDIYRRAGDAIKQGDLILNNNELSNEEKLKKLLSLDPQLITGVQGNLKLLMFISQKE
jgi:hypothetical protein